MNRWGKDNIIEILASFGTMAATMFSYYNDSVIGLLLVLHSDISLVTAIEILLVACSWSSTTTSHLSSSPRRDVEGTNKRREEERRYQSRKAADGEETYVGTDVRQAK
jgi:hypothetical protein